MITNPKILIKNETSNIYSTNDFGSQNLRNKQCSSWSQDLRNSWSNWTQVRVGLREVHLLFDDKKGRWFPPLTNLPNYSTNL